MSLRAVRSIFRCVQLLFYCFHILLHRFTFRQNHMIFNYIRNRHQSCDNSRTFTHRTHPLCLNNVKIIIFEGVFFYFPPFHSQANYTAFTSATFEGMTKTRYPLHTHVSSLCSSQLSTNPAKVTVIIDAHAEIVSICSTRFYMLQAIVNASRKFSTKTNWRISIHFIKTFIVSARGFATFRFFRFSIYSFFRRIFPIYHFWLNFQNFQIHIEIFSIYFTYSFFVAKSVELQAPNAFSTRIVLCFNPYLLVAWGYRRCWTWAKTHSMMLCCLNCRLTYFHAIRQFQ